MESRQAGGEYETYSEFQEADAAPRYDVNQEVLESDLYGVPSLMRGEVVESDPSNGSIHFSRESKGWHYGWMAGRGNGSHALHEMRVYLFERLNRDYFVCRLLLRSTPFQVTSRKRIRPKKASSSSSMNSEAKQLKKQQRLSRKDNNDDAGDVETPIKSSIGIKLPSSLPPPIPAPNIPHHHLMDMNEMNSTSSSTSAIPAPPPQQQHHHQTMQPPSQPHFSQPPLPSSKMDKPPAVPAFSRPKTQHAPFLSRDQANNTSGSSGDSMSSLGSGSMSHLPPPPTMHRSNQPRTQGGVPSFAQPQVSNPQSSQSTTATTTTAAAPKSGMGVGNWPFFASTPPIYQHPAGTPPVYQHSISTTPPMFNFSHLFGGSSGSVSAQDQATNSLFASMYQGQGAPIDDVLDLLMQPTPPNTFAALQMYRQAHQQQAYLQREKDEKEKQAVRGTSSSTVGTT
jgi:hypothetical protein